MEGMAEPNGGRLGVWLQGEMEMTFVHRGGGFSIPVAVSIMQMQFATTVHPFCSQ